MSNVRPQNMHIRPLTASDVLSYRELMLEAYASAADAFTATVEERAKEPESWWVRRIGNRRVCKSPSRPRLKMD